MNSTQGTEAGRLQAKADKTPLALTLSEVAALSDVMGRTPSELALTLLGRTEPYANTKECAAFLGKSTQVVLQWVKAGVIPATKQGKGYMFILSDVRKQLQNAAPEPQPVQSPQSRGRRRLDG
jgi:hypothetical protein